MHTSKHEDVFEGIDDAQLCASYTFVLGEPISSEEMIATLRFDCCYPPLRGNEMVSNSNHTTEAAS